MTQQSAPLNALIDRLRASDALDRPSVERALGVVLRPALTTDSLASFEAEGVKAGPFTISVDYREPVQGGPADGSSSIFSLDVTEGCPSKADMEARYSPWKLTGTPRGHSLNEKTYWSLYEPWGRLSFGFAERAPDCLASIVFAAGEREGQS